MVLPTNQFFIIDKKYICMCLGTKQTLWDIPKENKINICDKLLEFHSKWYSSHLMNLAVLGKGTPNVIN